MLLISESTSAARSQELISSKGAFDRRYWSCKHFELITASPHRNFTVIEDSLSAKPSSQQLFLPLLENVSLYSKAFQKTRKLRLAIGISFTPQVRCWCRVRSEPRIYMFQLKVLVDHRDSGFIKFSWGWMFEVTKSIVSFIIDGLNEHFLFCFFLSCQLHLRPKMTEFATFSPLWNKANKDWLLSYTRYLKLTYIHAGVIWAPSLQETARHDVVSALIWETLSTGTHGTVPWRAALHHCPAVKEQCSGWGSLQMVDMFEEEKYSFEDR